MTTNTGPRDPFINLSTGDSEYRHLGRFSDWVVAALEQNTKYPRHATARLTPARLREILGFAEDRDVLEPSVDGTWTRDGVLGEEVSWSVGYGPRTRAWLLRPAGVDGPLPSVVALHDHSHFKFLGKEKIADGPTEPDPLVVDLRRREYDGVAFANELARQGFAVLVHDVFLWGSRGFALEEMTGPESSGSTVEWLPPGKAPLADSDLSTQSEYVRAYNQVAIRHEHVVAKYCTLLGTSLAGVVAYEDRQALAYLKSRTDVSNGRVGCIGLSGGGCRAALLQALAPDISVSVIVCMMSTYDSLLDSHVAPHTWMFFPPGLATVGDWPELAACRAPSPLVVQYTRDDPLFPLQGMLAAHDRIGAVYAAAGAPDAYIGQFFDGDHRFDRTMQAAAFTEVARWLRR